MGGARPAATCTSIDRSLSARERDALVVGCDCYVSLHRSEGFGLTLAECMALGKPVIAHRVLGHDRLHDRARTAIPSRTS